MTRSASARVKNNENRVGRHKIDTVTRQNKLLFQALAREIRCSAEQRIFSVDQRIKAALSTENDEISASYENRKMWSPLVSA
jgi:hypothetical protein